VSVARDDPDVDVGAAVADENLTDSVIVWPAVRPALASSSVAKAKGPARADYKFKDIVRYRLPPVSLGSLKAFVSESLPAAIEPKAVDTGVRPSPATSPTRPGGAP